MKKIKFMNYLLIVSFLISVIFTSSCGKQEIVSEKEITAVVPQEPVFNKELPVFPSWVSFVLQREFYYKKNQKQTNLDYYEYIEHRLIELYPEIAYEGMMDEAKSAIEEFKANYEE